MAEIDDPQLTDFCNTMLRQLADKMALIDSVLPVLMVEYNARNLGGIIDAAGAGNLIADGSASDGRTRRVGGDVYNFVTAIQALQDYFAVSGRREVILGWQVNGVKVG